MEVSSQINESDDKKNIEEKSPVNRKSRTMSNLISFNNKLKEKNC